MEKIKYICWYRLGDEKDFLEMELSKDSEKALKEAKEVYPNVYKVELIK
jgi:hypothetical protein